MNGESGFTVLIPNLLGNTRTILSRIGTPPTDIYSEINALLSRIGDPSPSTLDFLIDTILSRVGDPSPSNLDTLIDAILGDLGDASGSALGSIYGILGNPPSTITAQNAGILASVGVHDTDIKTRLGTPTLPATIDSLIDSIIADVSGIKGTGWDSGQDTLFDLGQSITHSTSIFPEATNLTVTLNSHANANTWSAWTEIADSGATTFSSKVDAITHITAICVEDTSAANETWMLEISYGGAYAVVASLRFVSGTVGILPAIQQFRIRSSHIPVGQTVYYRLMCSAGNKNCKIHIRYYKHA